LLASFAPVTRNHLCELLTKRRRSQDIRLGDLEALANGVDAVLKQYAAGRYRSR
jgi:hypothetical protein